MKKYIIDWSGTRLDIMPTENYSEDSNYYKYCEFFNLVNDDLHKLESELNENYCEILGLSKAFDYFNGD